MKTAGFLATRSADLSLANGETIIWDMVVRNEGGHYSPGTGAYTVPLNGTYLVHTQVGGNMG